MVFNYIIINDLRNKSCLLNPFGPDANTFLQGQFTQDLRLFLENAAYGLWLNSRGKALADSFVLRLQDNHYLIFSPHTKAETLRQRLEDYLVADEVTLSDKTDEWAWIAWWGEGARAVLQQAGASTSETANLQRLESALIWPGRSSLAENYWLLCPKTDAPTWLARLQAAGASEATEEEADRERIVSGIPHVPDDIGPSDFPNEGGLEHDAISYNKGCYLGQEVMSRLKNLGQIRRCLHLVRGNGAAPALGTPLQQNGGECGQIRTSAKDGSDGFVAMAMMSLLRYEPNSPVTLPDQRVVAVLPLPQKSGPSPAK